MEFTTTKSTVECYKIRSTTGGYWADITIDASGNAGRIQIASDYGSWQNYWNSCGSDFKDFLGRINQDYAADKFEVEDWEDVGSTILYMKKELFAARKQDQVTAADARNIFDEIVGLKDCRRQDLAYAINTTHYLSGFLYDIDEFQPVQYETSPRFVRFWKEIWPVLLAEFKREAEPVTA